MTHHRNRKKTAYVKECILAKLPLTEIANNLNISVLTLKKHYRREIEEGGAKLQFTASKKLYEFLEADYSHMPEIAAKQAQLAEKIMHNHGYGQSIVDESKMPRIVVSVVPRPNLSESAQDADFIDVTPKKLDNT